MALEPWLERLAGIRWLYANGVEVTPRTKILDVKAPLAAAYNSATERIELSLPALWMPFIHTAQISSGNTTAARFHSLASSLGPTSAEAEAQFIAPLAGVIGRFWFRYQSALPAADTNIVVRVNGVDTAIALNIVAGATGPVSDLVTEVPVVPGDLISIRTTTSAADGSSVRPRSVLCFRPTA